MKGTKDINDSLNEIKIYKPKPKRLCPPRKKINKSSSATSSSSSNSEKCQILFDIEESKINLNDISIEEINNDFFLYGQNLEEEECQNELCNILNNSSENNFSNKINHNNSNKIKRCKNKFEEKNFEYLNSLEIDDLFKDMISNQK